MSLSRPSSHVCAFCRHYVTSMCPPGQGVELGSTKLVMRYPDRWIQRTLPSTWRTRTSLGFSAAGTQHSFHRVLRKSLTIHVVLQKSHEGIEHETHFIQMCSNTQISSSGSDPSRQTVSPPLPNPCTETHHRGIYKEWGGAGGCSARRHRQLNVCERRRRERRVLHWIQNPTL